MATGRDLMTNAEDETESAQHQPQLIPSRKDYGYVKDESCKEILNIIFAMKKDGKLKKTIKNVGKKNIFAIYY